MEFIDFEASEIDQENEDLVFSGDENKDNGKVTDNFVDDSEQVNESNLSFCRGFTNQAKDPRVAIYKESDDETYLNTRGLQLELYLIEERERVIFDEFSEYEKSVEKFKKLLSSFSDTNNENSFFDVVIYGLMFKLTEGKIVAKDTVESALEVEFTRIFAKSKINSNLTLQWVF